MGPKYELQVCMEGSRWRWCQPCGIDVVGTNVRCVPDSKQKLTLINAVKAINSLHKEVTIRQQIQVASSKCVFQAERGPVSFRTSRTLNPGMFCSFEVFLSISSLSAVFKHLIYLNYSSTEGQGRSNEHLVSSVD